MAETKKVQAGDDITYAQFDTIVQNLEIYKFKVLKTFSIDHTFTFYVDLKEMFELTGPLTSYEMGGVLVPYRSYQTGGWYPRYNRWWTTQKTEYGKVKFTFTRQSAGYWGTPYNKKWFSIVVWVKPLTEETKKEMMPQNLFKPIPTDGTSSKANEVVTWASIEEANAITTSDTIKSYRFSPPKTGYTALPFKKFFPNFDVKYHRVSTVPSIQGLYTMENYGVEQSGSLSANDIVDAYNVYKEELGTSTSPLSVNDDWQWLDVQNSAINSNREIEFLMFKGIR